MYKFAAPAHDRLWHEGWMPARRDYDGYWMSSGPQAGARFDGPW